MRYETHWLLGKYCGSCPLRMTGTAELVLGASTLGTGLLTGISDAVGTLPSSNWSCSHLIASALSAIAMELWEPLRDALNLTSRATVLPTFLMEIGYWKPDPIFSVRGENRVP